VAIRLPRSRVGLQRGRADEFGQAAHADVVGSASSGVLGVLVDRLELVDRDGMLRLSVALGGFCCLVVKFGNAGEPRMRSLASLRVFGVGQCRTRHRVGDFGQVDGVQAGCVASAS
jgi:hypothetical protein